MPNHNIYIRTHTGIVEQDGEKTAAVTESQEINRDLCELLGVDKVGDSPFQRELAYLFNVARMPKLYPEVKDRPRRALGGMALYEWMGKRLKITAAEVRLFLGE